MAAKAILNVAVRTAGMVVVFTVGFIVIRIAQMAEEDRSYAERRARFEAAQRAPSGPPVRATAEDCAMFRQIAVRHYQARDMPVADRVSRGGLLEEAYPSGVARNTPGLSGPQARSIARASWQVTGDYLVACDWRGSGLVSDEDLVAAGGGKPACPPNASVVHRDDGMISPDPEPRREPRDYVCRDRPAGAALPWIGFSRPLRSDDGRRAIVSTRYVYGNLGAKGYECLFKRREKTWVLDRCRHTWIS